MHKLHQAFTFAALTALVSVGNDIVAKFISHGVPNEQVTFLRFFFSFITLLPFARKESFLTLHNHFFLQAFRGAIGALAIGLFIYALNNLPLPVVTVLSLTQTLFALPISFIFLKEKISFKTALATCLGFCGVLVFFWEPLNFSPYYFVLLLSSFLFASLDMLAKKLVQRASFFSMLFHFSLVTTCIAAPFAFRVWTPLPLRDTLLLLALGGGANLIQVTLFLALKNAPAHRISPFRYLEVIFSCVFGWFLFQENLSHHMLLGTLLIVLSTYYLCHTQHAEHDRMSSGDGA